MSATDKDLSAYIEVTKANMDEMMLFTGFLFTGITILVTWIPNPSELLSRIALFFLSVLFYLMLGLIDMIGDRLSFCVKYAPKYPEGYNMKRMNLFAWTISILFGLSVPLLFLLRGLICLTAASLIAYGLSFIPQRRWSTKYADQALAKLKRIDVHEDEN